MLRTSTALASLALLGSAALCAHALADDGSEGGNDVGYYLGASLGISNLDQSFYDEGLGAVRHFNDSRTGWKVLMGVRPLEWLGAEVEYLDFGDAHLGRSLLVPGGPVSDGVFYGGHASATAGAGFLVGYLPLPPALDLFGKLGVSRLQARDSYAANYPDTYVNCAVACTPVGAVSVAQNATATGLAVGAGAQIHLGAFAARLEGERFNGAGGTYLVSIGVTWEP